MTNFEYYKTKEDAKKAYCDIISSKLAETGQYAVGYSAEDYINWLYDDCLETDAKYMIKKFMDYFGVRNYDDIKDSPWYKNDPKWLSECLDREANKTKQPYDTACCDKVIISILKLLISKDKKCIEIGLEDADFMMNKYYTKEGHSEDTSLRNDYLRFIEMLSCFMSSNAEKLRYTEDRRHGEHSYVIAYERYDDDTHRSSLNTYFDCKAVDLKEAIDKFTKMANENYSRYGYKTNMVKEDGTIIFDRYQNEINEYEYLRRKFSELDRYLELKNKFGHLRYNE